MPSTFFSASIASSNPLRREFGKSICDETDRKSTRLNSSHTVISYAVFCLKKKKNNYVLHPLSLVHSKYDRPDGDDQLVLANIKRVRYNGAQRASSCHRMTMRYEDN